MKDFAATHKTKTGFGGILKEGIMCNILHKNQNGSVLVHLGGQSFFWGKINDLIDLRNDN